MANTNITSNNFFDPRRYREVYDEEKKAWVKEYLPQKPPKKQIDFPSRQKEIDEEKRRRAEELKKLNALTVPRKPPKKKVKPASWDKMKTDRPKTPLTPEEYFKKIR